MDGQALLHRASNLLHSARPRGRRSSASSLRDTPCLCGTDLHDSSEHVYDTIAIPHWWPWHSRRNRFKPQPGLMKDALHSQAIELDPSNHVFYSNRSAAYLSSKQADKALEDADACIKANPTWAKGFSRRGAALHELGRVDEAVAAYDEGLAIEPTNAGLREGRQSAMRAMAQNPFADLVSWCAIHPKFRDYMSDPTFVNSIRMLSTNPSALSAVGSDARIMEVIAQRLGLDLGGAAGGDDDSSAAAPAADHSAASSGPATEGSAAEASAAGAEEPEPEYSEEEKADMERERAEAEAAAKIRAEADAAKARGNAHYKKREFGEALRLVVPERPRRRPPPA